MQVSNSSPVFGMDPMSKKKAEQQQNGNQQPPIALSSPQGAQNPQDLTSRLNVTM